MKNFLYGLLALILVSCSAKPDYDVCIYGGTASGVIAAYSAAQMGQKVILIEPSVRIGGMTTGGLGLTDIGNKQVVKGLGLQFYRKLGEHYGTLEQWVFEPSAAKDILDSYLEHKNIKTILNHHLCSTQTEGTQIKSISVTDGSDELHISAKVFIDCSYEGDLMADAGVEYRVGREANSEYNETWDGVELLEKKHQFPDGVDPYVVPGKPESGLLWGITDDKVQPNGTGDKLVQAYNYRICLTDSVENRIPITKPENYDPSVYELLVRVYEAQPEMTDVNQYFIWSHMPNRKTDVNNRGAFSTDMIGMSHNYPEASWEERQAIIQAHKDYTLGLLYFTATDPRVPKALQDYVKEWGLPKDEYIETGNWTPQLYVRECRRMVGEYVASQADCENRVIAPEGVAYAAYTMDSHNAQRIVVEKDGKLMVKNEGNVEVHGGSPYPISYKSITPKREQCTNLLVPVALSATHIAYGSIRMEPVFICLGQVAGIAASMYNSNKLSKVQDVDYLDINKIIADDPYMDGSQPDIIIDDADVTELGGTWISKKGSGAYGPSYITGSSEDGYARYTATIQADGEYDIYSYQHVVAGLNPQTIFELSDGRQITVDVTDVKVVGQTTSAWHKLASASLKAGEEFCITIHGNGTPGKTHADAILFVKK